MYEDDWDDEFEVDDDDHTAPCRVCGQLIYDDAPRCPYCGDYDPHGGRRWAWSDKPKWLVWVAVILVLGTALAFAWPYIATLILMGR